MKFMKDFGRVVWFLFKLIAVLTLGVSGWALGAWLMNAPYTGVFFLGMLVTVSSIVGCVMGIFAVIMRTLGLRSL